VKKKIMSVLGSWYRQFKDDPKMQLVAGLYASCGGGRKVRKAPGGPSGHCTGCVADACIKSDQIPTKTDATAAYEKQQARYEEEARLRAERKAAERSAKEQEKARLAKKREDEEKARRQRARGKRPPFNFDQVGCTSVGPNWVDRVSHAVSSSTGEAENYDVGRSWNSICSSASVELCDSAYSPF
jgi:hypothetical protein